MRVRVLASKAAAFGAALVAALATTGGSAVAATLHIVGVFPNKAVVAIDDGQPRSVAVGETVAGYRIVAVGKDSVTVVSDGRRETFPISAYVGRAGPSSRANAVLTTDARVHYKSEGAINGVTTRFIVDTGATLVVLSKAEGDRLALPYKEGPTGLANTANGAAQFHLVKLDRVKVGGVELTQVDAAVLDGSYDGPNLLGMSFLSRTEVSRDGANMVLTRRF